MFKFQYFSHNFEAQLCKWKSVNSVLNGNWLYPVGSVRTIERAIKTAIERERSYFCKMFYEDRLNLLEIVLWGLTVNQMCLCPQRYTSRHNTHIPTQTYTLFTIYVQHKTFSLGQALLLDLSVVRSLPHCVYNPRDYHQRTFSVLNHRLFSAAKVNCIELPQTFLNKQKQAGLVWEKR